MFNDLKWSDVTETSKEGFRLKAIEKPFKKNENGVLERDNEHAVAFRNEKLGNTTMTAVDFKSTLTDLLLESGVKTNQDVLKLRNTRVGDVKLTGAVQTQDLIKFAGGESGSGVQVSNFSTLFTYLIRQIGSTEDPSWALSEFFPDAMYTSWQIALDIMDANIGTLFPRAMQTPVPQVPRLGNKIYTFTPFTWAAEQVFSEEDIFQRFLGSQNIAQNGLIQRLGYAAYNMFVRMFTTKKLLLSQMIFNGSVTWNGVTLSAGIPSANQLVPVGPNWGTYSSGTGLWTINSSAYPLLDIQYALNQYPQLRKYQGLKKKMFLNPNTHMLFFANPNNQNTIQYSMANEKVLNPEDPFNMKTAIKYFMGSQNDIEVVVVNDQYIPEANDPFGNTAGVSTYLFPDSKILFAIDTSSYGGPLGEFAYSIAAQNGGMFNPQVGPYVVMEDCSAPGSRGGVGNPSINVIAGFNGMPKINRPFDIIVMDVNPA